MGIRTVLVCAGLSLLGAGCTSFEDFGRSVPAPATLKAEDYRLEIVAIDRLVFERGRFSETRRAALAAKLDELALRLGNASASRFVVIETLELKGLAARWRNAESDAAAAPLANQWMRIRANLFDDCAWFARSAADLDASPQPAVAPAVARLMEQLKAVKPPYPSLPEVLAVGEGLLAQGATAKPAALPLANWLRYYAHGPYEQDPKGPLHRLASIVTALDPEAGYYADARLHYDRSGSSQDRWRAIMLLRYLRLPRERTVPVLRSAMDDADEWVREIAAAGLEAYGEVAPPDPRSLTERLLAGSTRVNEQALAEVGALSGQARAALARAWLASGQPRDAYAVGVLVYRLKDPVVQATVLDAIDAPAMRQSALVAFGYELPLPRNRVPSLVAAMGDPRSDVRDEARRVLLRMSPNRRSLVPILIAAVAEGPPAQKESAATALAEITGRAYGTDAARWRMWRDARIEGEAPELLLPGEHHASEVPLNADGTWWAICGPEGRRDLRRVAVTVRTFFDAVVDREGEPTGARVDVAGCNAPLALTRYVTGLTEGVLPEGTASPVRDGVADLRFGTERFAIRQQAQGTTGYRLEYFLGGRVQTLYAADETSGDILEGKLWSVAWVGDLDGDGKPDLLLNATNHYNVGQTSLFLSGTAPPGGLLKKVATFTTVGC